MRFDHNFATDFELIVERWRSGIPFAFSRFGDGEAAILRARERPFRTTRPTERWQSDQLQGAFRKALHASLVAKLDDYVVGILCPHCSDISSEYLWKQVPDHDRSRFTFAEIFGNANWPRVDWVELLGQTSTFVVGSSKRADLQIPIDLPTSMDRIEEVVVALLKVEAPIALCAGPAANVIVHQYWERQPADRRQVCIDFGSTIDPWLHGDRTRGHHAEGSWDQTLRCTFDVTQTRNRGFVPPMFRR
jgi:hypothetical protein